MSSSDVRSLAIQTVIYQNDPAEIIRAVHAVAQSTQNAVSDGFIAMGWKVLLGDCSPTPTFSAKTIHSLEVELNSRGGELEYTYFDANLGSAEGHNRLSALADSETILILNPDAQAAPDCISFLAQSLIEGVGSVEARQIPIEHPKYYDAVSRETSWSSTACLLTSRDAYSTVGGFDAKTFFLYCDDVDYSWALRLMGLRVLYEPAATVFHDKRLNIRGEWPTSEAEEYYSAEAALLLAYKYSRNDLLETLLTDFATQSSASRKALKEFRRREKAGVLPARVDSKHAVATFVSGNYTTHRF